MTRLNWLGESGLPWENEDKQEKNTGEGQQQGQLLCDFSPWGCVQRLGPTDRTGAWPHPQKDPVPFSLFFFFARIGMTWLDSAWY